MPNTTKMVTLEHGGDSHTISGDTEMPIHEAAMYSGYTVSGLRRVDLAGERGFPPAHRRDGGTSRYWYASEIEKIVEFRHKMSEDLGKRLKKTRKVWSKVAAEARAQKKAKAAA